MVSIKTIAEKAGVSVTTVSRALNNNGYVSNEKRARIDKAVRELNFSPSLIARSLVARESKLIGVLIPHIRSPFFTGIVTGVEEEARKSGYNVLLYHTGEDIETEKKCLKIIIGQRADGIIVTPVGREYRHWVPVIRTIPTVMIARRLPDLLSSTVEVDNRVGSYNVIRHLISLGHRRIGIVNGPLGISTAQERWEGVQAAFRDFEIPFERELVVNGEFLVEKAFDATNQLLSLPKPPTALFAANNVSSIGMLSAVRRRGLRIPAEIAISAFDGYDDSEVGSIIEPQITANIHPTREMAVTAFRLLMEQRNFVKSGNLEDFSPRNIVIGMRLALRSSTLGQTAPGSTCTCRT